MNCKQGDLAVVVKSYCGNEGKIVRCVEFAGDILTKPAPGRVEIAQCWLIDPPMMTSAGVIGNYAADYQLRPLRDNDGQDETLTWAGKPQGVTA